MPRPRLGPERGHTLCASLRSLKACQDNEPTTQTPFCASLRSRNACQDFTRASLCRNLQEKCRAPEWAPWSSTGLYILYSYRIRTPLCVDTLFGENVKKHWIDPPSCDPQVPRTEAGRLKLTKSVRTSKVFGSHPLLTKFTNEKKQHQKIRM